MGARRWIARILLTWGIIAALTGFVWSEWSFYGIRFLLGLAEAGFYPGVLLYLTWWFPSYYRTRMMGIFQSASVISLFIGPPVGGLLLLMQGMLGLQGWQWLFLIEGIGTILIGVLLNGLVLMNVSSYVQQIIIGVIIVLAVAFDTMAKSRRRTR